MIAGFLIEKCVKKLQDSNNWHSIQVGSTPDGQPHPHCPDFFVSIFSEQIKNVMEATPQQCHILEIDFVARISLRTKMTPPDRMDLLYFKNTLSLMRIATKVLKTLMDNRETIRAEVNSALESANEEYNAWMGMTRSFKWLSTETQPIPRDNSWFFSREPNDQDSFNTAGYSVDVNFGEVHGTFRSLE